MASSALSMPGLSKRIVKASPEPRDDVHAELSRAGPGRTVESYRRGQAIFLQGAVADAVYYIQKGSVRITAVSKQGRAAAVALLGSRQFFGEGCLAGQLVQLATASAAGPSTITRIDKGRMVRKLREEPPFSRLFLSFLLSRNIQAEADLVDHLFNSSEMRLAGILLSLASVGRKSMAKTLPRISRDSLAAQIGTSRSKIDLFMNKFRKLGFIEYSGGLRVHSSLLNVIVYDQVPAFS